MESPIGGYHIETIVNCGVNVAAPSNSFVIFDAATDMLGGWSHVADTPAYANLAMDPAVYSFDNFVTAADASCNEVPTHSAILVKKFADWDAQHSSGLTAEFLPQGLTFGDISEIVIELKLNSEGSSIPSTEEIATKYGSYLEDFLLETWDMGKANLGITLYGEGNDDPAVATINGMRIVEIDQAEYFDDWVRITIDADALFWYSEQNYVRTALEAGAYEDAALVGLRINPETASEVVLRNQIGNDAWLALETPPEELFKEMDISIKRVELRLNP